jgi:hypothetical protein
MRAALLILGLLGLPAFAREGLNKSLDNARDSHATGW